jgi:hypothetical protein
MISKIKKYNFIDNIEYAYVLEDTTINSIEDTMKVYVPKLMVGCTIDKSNINLNTIINKKDFDKLYTSTISCVNYLTIKPISLNPMVIDTTNRTIIQFIKIFFIYYCI